MTASTHRPLGSALTRRSFLGAVGLATAGLATGCAHGYEQASGGSVPDKFAKRLHIVAWHSYGSNLGIALQKLVDEFHAAQNDIFVELQYQGSYEATQQKLSAGIIAKLIPDMASLSEVTWRAMHLADALEPLNDYFGHGLEPDQYITQFIEEGTVKKNIWWLPFARSTPLFYYNKQIWSAAGLPDRAPHTWDEFREWSPAIAKVKAKSGGPVRPMAMVGGYSAWYFQGNIWEWGGHYSHGLDILLDQPAPMAAVQWMDDFVHKDGYAYLSASQSVDFGNGVAAAALMSTASLANMTELTKAAGYDIGTGFVPKDKQFGCPTGGSGWGIMTEAPAERKQAAFEFLKFLGQPERSAEWTMASGYLPIVTAAQKDPRLVDLVKKDPNFGTSLRQLPQCKTQDLARLLIPDASTFMDHAFEDLYSSGISARDMVNRLANKMRSRAALIQQTYEEHYL